MERKLCDLKRLALSKQSFNLKRGLNGSLILMTYFIKNKSGYRCAVSEKLYNELVDKKGYTGEIIEESKPKYPIDKGAGWFELSNGKSVRGEQKAIEAENEL